MSFGENLQYLRRRDVITQETLAERFGVSRQTVSKWESDGAFPEMDKLILLCEMFDVTMDDLVRGSVENTVTESEPEESGVGKDEYIRRCRIFAARITGGVAAILTGVALLLILSGFALTQAIPVAALFIFIIIGVALCIVGGIDHDGFRKQCPTLSFRFEPEELAAVNRRFAWQIVAGVVGILLDVTLLTVLSLSLPEIETNEAVAMVTVGIFMLILAAAVSLIVWAGIIKDSYDPAKLSGVQRKEPLADRLSGVIMLTATAVFLLLGFVWNLWHPGWAVFPIGGIVCGIVAIITEGKE